MIQRAPNKKAIKAILTQAGGEIELSAHLSRKFKRPVSQFAIRAWLDRGIPECYWPELARLAGVSIDVICRACGD